MDKAPNPLTDGLADVLELEPDDILDPSTDTKNDGTPPDPGTANADVDLGGIDLDLDGGQMTAAELAALEKTDDPPPPDKTDDPPADQKTDDAPGIEIDLNADDPPPADEPDEEMDKVENAISDEAQRKAFQSMRKRLREAETALKAKPSDQGNERVEQLQQRLAEAEDKIGSLKLSESPQFKAKYDQPYLAKLQQAAEFVKRAGGNVSDIRRIAAIKDPVDRHDAIREIAGDYTATVVNLFGEADLITQQAAAELKDWKASTEELQAEAAQQHSVITGELAKKAYTTTLKSLQESETLSLLFAEQDGNEGVNTMVRNLQSQALDAFVTDNPEQQQKLMMMGVATEPLLKAYLKERGRAASAIAQLTKLTGSAPNLDSSSPPATNQPQNTVDPTEELTPEEAAARVAARINLQS